MVTMGVVVVPSHRMKEMSFFEIVPAAKRELWFVEGEMTAHKS